MTTQTVERIGGEQLPSNRNQEIAPEVQALSERYGLTYTSGPLPTQVASAWKKVFRLALPNDAATGPRRLPRGWR